MINLDIFLVDNSLLTGLNIGILSAIVYISTSSGILTIVAKNPIHSVIFLITLFSTVSVYLFASGIDFIGFAYLLVYVGAVSILFLFILMLINIRISELYSGSYNNIILSFLVFLAFLLSKDEFLPEYSSLEKLSLDNLYVATSIEWTGSLTELTQIASIGNVMYSAFAMWFFMVALILLLSMVGAIIITIRPNDTNITSYQMSLLGGSSRKPDSSDSPVESSSEAESLKRSVSKSDSLKENDSESGNSSESSSLEDSPSESGSLLDVDNNLLNDTPRNTESITEDNFILEDGLDDVSLSDDSSYEDDGHMPTRNEGGYFPRELGENETAYDSPDTDERERVDSTPSDEGYNTDSPRHNPVIDDVENQFHIDKSEGEKIARDNAVSEGNFELAYYKNKDFIRASLHIQRDPNDDDLYSDPDSDQEGSQAYYTDSYTSDPDLQWLREERDLSVQRRNYDRALEYDKQIKAYKQQNGYEPESSATTAARTNIGYEPESSATAAARTNIGYEPESSATAAARTNSSENVAANDTTESSENVVSADTTESSENVAADNTTEYSENQTSSRDKGKRKADSDDSFDYPSKKSKRVSLDESGLEKSGLDDMGLNTNGNGGYAYKDSNDQILLDIAKFIEYLSDNYIIILSNIEIYPFLPLIFILFKNTYLYRKIKTYLIRKVKIFFDLIKKIFFL